MANIDEVKAELVAGTSLSTVKSSEAAMARPPRRKADNERKRPGDARRADIRDRDDIDRVQESPDRYFRELAKVDGELASLRAKKIRLLQSILAFRAGLGMPDKGLITATEQELQDRFDGQ